MQIKRLDDPPVAVSHDFAGFSFGIGGGQHAMWSVPEEVPLAILLNGEHFAVMMVTPADLEDYAIGFMLNERVIQKESDLSSLSIVEADDGYVLDLRLDPELVGDSTRRRRSLVGGSSCGMCGTQILSADLLKLNSVYGLNPRHDAVMRAFSTFARLQVMKQQNRSTHAAAICDIAGRVDYVREDIGRHNALDKLAGAVARNNHDVSRSFILLSSRISFEMIQKAAEIGVSFIAAASAPTALSLRMAAKAGLTLAVKCCDDLMIFPPNTVVENVG